MFGWWQLLPGVVVLIVLFSEHLCDDIFIGPALRIGNPQESNSSRYQNTAWPALGTNQNHPSQEFARPNGAGIPRIRNENWPVVGERRDVNNYNTPSSSQSSGSNSFVQSQIQRWNSQSSRNKSYANTLTANAPHNNYRPDPAYFRTTSRPFTGIQFGNNNGEEKKPDISANKKDFSYQVTDGELREFSEGLLSKDDNNAAKYVQINFQGRTTSRSKVDEAPQPLMYISREAYDIPTIAKLQPLYDNYIEKADVDEDYTNEEKREENALLKAVLETNVMKTTRNFLIEKGAITRSERDFENLMHDIWFHQYSRGKRKLGSSGFEHVFLAEIKKGEVSGLHNWLYFEKEEANRRANYLGYLKKIELGNKGAILKFNFDYHGINKPVGSMFIGTSPEFEMALYSTCFILRADKICPLKLNGHRFIIRTFTYRYDGKNLIGSAFAEI